jgi:hypothetical protein
MSNTSIKISQLPSLGTLANGNTILPVVNTNGLLTTEKVTVANIANFTLNEAGNTLLPAFLSTYSLNVINANQPNITSTGTLSSFSINDIANLNIPGGANGDYITTDGNGNLSWQVLNPLENLANYTGNIGNLSFIESAYSTLFGDTNSYLELRNDDTRLANDEGNVEVWSQGNIFTFASDGIFHVPNSITASGNIDASRMQLSQGANIGALSVIYPGNLQYVDIANGNISASGMINVNGTISAVGDITTGANFIVTNGIFYGNGNPYIGEAAGSNTEIQFNDENGFGASSSLTFDKITGNLNVPSGFLNAAAVSTTGLVSCENLYVNGQLNASNDGYINNLIPNFDVSYNLGNGTQQWSSLFVSTVSTNKTDPLQLQNPQGNVNIIAGGSTWKFTTEGGGNTYLPPSTYLTTSEGSMYVQSKGDYEIYAYDQTTPTQSGGKILAQAGQGATGTINGAGGTGGEIRIHAGAGGTTNNTYQGGAGGLLEFKAGDGSDGSQPYQVMAQPGGNLFITAGSSGTNDGNASLGSYGGNITLSAGNTTGTSMNGGNIIFAVGESSDGNRGVVTTTGNIVLKNNMLIENNLNGYLNIGGTDSYISINDNNPTGFTITTNNTGNQYKWYFDNESGVISPVSPTTLNVGYTQTYTSGSVKRINGDPFPASAPQNTDQTIYMASSADIIGATLTLRVQASNFSELINIDIVKEYSNANVTFSIGTRLKSNPSIADTIISVDQDVTNKLIVNANCQATGFAYYTYDVKEYKYTYD